MLETTYALMCPHEIIGQVFGILGLLIDIPSRPPLLIQIPLKYAANSALFVLVGLLFSPSLDAHGWRFEVAMAKVDNIGVILIINRV